MMFLYSVCLDKWCILGLLHIALYSQNTGGGLGCMQHKGCQQVDASVNGDYSELMYICLMSFISLKKATSMPKFEVFGL